MPKVFVLLPAFNEELALRRLIPDIARELTSLDRPFRICLVDDGSKDKTAEFCRALAREVPLQHLRHEQNEGYGAAIHTGVKWIVQQGDSQDVAITLDADN